MSDTPKRPRGRPPTGASSTPAQRKAASRARRDVQSLDLPRAAAEALDARMERYGVRSRLAVVERMLDLTR